MNEEDRRLETLAEIAAISQAIGLVLQGLALMSREPDKFLQSHLEAGLETIEQMPLGHVTDEQRGRVIELASARFSELMATAGSNLKKSSP